MIVRTGFLLAFTLFTTVLQARAASTVPETPPILMGPVSAAFAEGTSASYVDQIVSQIEALNGTGFYTAPRWPGALGTPLALTWSLVPDGVTVPGVIGEPSSPSELFAQMDAKFAAQGGRTAWLFRIQQCFDRWQELSGLSFSFVSVPGQDWDDGAAIGSVGASGQRGDIRLMMHPIDGLHAVIDFSELPGDGDIVLDSAETWGELADDNRLIRNAITRQIGISVGLKSVCSNLPVLMNPFVGTTFDGPRHDDIRGVQSLYGDPREEDDAPGTANDLGVIALGTTQTNACDLPLPPTGTNSSQSSVCSIDADAEVDWWKFTVNQGALVSVTLTPLGLTYGDSPQTPSNPNCSQTTHTTNSLVAADLKLQLFASDGSTLLTGAPSQPAGVPELITDQLVSSGSFLILVSEDGTTTAPQSYSITITVRDSCLGSPDCNGNGVRDVCDIAAGTSVDNNGNAVPDECENFVGQAFCAGDQHDIFFQPCPCDNAGDLGHGCANSANAAGALLAVTGLTQPVDTLHLNATLMPTTASAIFLKGDANASGGISFGDGVRCVDGSLIRLGTLTSVAGACSYPTGAQTAVSVRGATPIGSGLVAYYQTYYRNAASTFCPPETFNVTNGFIITW